MAEPGVTTLPVEAASHAYYRPLHGAWRCAYDFAITDHTALRSSAMGWLDRQRVLSMVWTPRLLGPLTLDTTVDYFTHGASGVVLHTTRASKWGIPLFSSAETITLHENGTDFTLQGGQRMFPSFWRVRDFGDGRGTVDASGTRASYTFAWLGTEMRQTTIASGDTVTITQETAWSRGVQVLKRVR